MSPPVRCLPPRWARVPLGEVVEILDSLRVPVNAEQRASRQGAIPYYGATGQVGWIDESIFDEELVLLGEDAAPFLDPAKPKAYVIRGKSWVNNHAHVLRGKGISNSFLMHQLNALDYHGAVTGTTRLKLPQAPMKKLSLVLPPRDEQDRIVAEIEKQFTRLDAGVEALRRLQAHLRRYRAAVLKAACEGRLVPAEAELARNAGHSYEPAARLLERAETMRRDRWSRANGKKRYPEPTSLSGKLGPLPEGWAWATFEQLSTRVTVGHVGPMKDEYIPDGIPFLRSQNVRENRFDPSGLLRISAAFHAKLSKSVLRPGDLCIVRSGAVGTTCVVPESLGEANCADLVIVQGPFGVLPRFAAYYMNSLAKARVRAGRVGIALTHFNTKSVAGLPVPVPPLAEQERIVSTVEAKLSEIDAMENTVAASLKRSSQLRRAVLGAAFDGRLVNLQETARANVA